MRTRLVSVTDLTAPQRDAMFRRLDDAFENVGRDRFEDDLAGKHFALLVESADGAVAGFTTLRHDLTNHDGRPIAVVSSGDTIVGREAWGSSALLRGWIAAVRLLRGRAPERPAYWLLIVSGLRTYRLLPVFWRVFHPCCARRTPRATRRLMDVLARDRYGAQYDPETGIVRFPHPQVLRPALRAVPPARRRDPHVAHFLRRNPGHARGDELVCLAELSDANLTRAGARMAAAGRRETHAAC